MAKKIRKEYSRNETLALMHTNDAETLRNIADAVERWGYSAEEIIEFLREVADQQEAQAIVVELRDKL